MQHLEGFDRVFTVSPTGTSAQTFLLALEDREIRLRLERAFHGGRATCPTSEVTAAVRQSAGRASRAAIQLFLIALAAAALGCAGWSDPQPAPLRSSESAWWNDRCGPDEASREVIGADGTVLERECIPTKVISPEGEGPSRCSAPVEDPSCFCLADPTLPRCPTSAPTVPAEPGP